MNSLETIKSKLLEAEEQSILDNIDQYEWLIEHTIEDHDTVLDNFIRNYKTTNTHSIIAFGGYESPEAEYIISRIGKQATIDLVLQHISISQDFDMYQEHWNDIGSAQWDEYETQIDIDEDHPNYNDFKGTADDSENYGISFHGYVCLGMLRYKLDTESFEKALYQQHGIDVNSLIDLPEPIEV